MAAHMNDVLELLSGYYVLEYVALVSKASENTDFVRIVNCTHLVYNRSPSEMMKVCADFADASHANGEHVVGWMLWDAKFSVGYSFETGSNAVRKVQNLVSDDADLSNLSTQQRLMLAFFPDGPEQDEIYRDALLFPNNVGEQERRSKFWAGRIEDQVYYILRWIGRNRTLNLPLALVCVESVRHQRAQLHKILCHVQPFPGYPEVVEKRLMRMVQEGMDALGDRCHDWCHVQRVMANASELMKKWEGPPFEENVVKFGALLHDIADKKLVAMQKTIVDVDMVVESLLAARLITKQGARSLRSIITDMGFHKVAANPKDTEYTPEFSIVFDADQLDALGAIGIMRTFAFGGKINNQLVAPDEKVDRQVTDADLQTYLKTGGKGASTVSHFYQKLFHIPDVMLTYPGKSIAWDRLHIMYDFMRTLSRELGESDTKT